MSKITKLDFLCGAGLSILLRRNENLSPSFVESIKDVEGRNTSGVFYKFKTKKGKEAIIYIKCSSKQIAGIKNLSFCWDFSLTTTEKEKINKQILKRIPFFILLICVENLNGDIANGEAALLTIDDYNKISGRSNIRIGLWTDNINSKKEKQKVYVVRNSNGNGTSREYYFDVKRNQVEKVSLDELISKYYPSYESKQEDSIPCDKVNTTFKANEEEYKIKIFVTDNPRSCSRCGTECKYKLIKYLKSDKSEHKINVAICQSCGHKHITFNFYDTFIKGNPNSDIQFIKYDYIYLLDDNSFGCKKCDNELCTVETSLKIHHNIGGKDDFIEANVAETLFYCKKCKLLYANNAVKRNLLNKYGYNKILFKHYKK